MPSESMPAARQEQSFEVLDLTDFFLHSNMEAHLSNFLTEIQYVTYQIAIEFELLVCVFVKSFLVKCTTLKNRNFCFDFIKSYFELSRICKENRDFRFFLSCQLPTMVCFVFLKLKCFAVRSTRFGQHGVQEEKASQSTRIGGGWNLQNTRVPIWRARQHTRWRAPRFDHESGGDAA